MQLLNHAPQAFETNGDDLGQIGLIPPEELKTHDGPVESRSFSTEVVQPRTGRAAYPFEHARLPLRSRTRGGISTAESDQNLGDAAFLFAVRDLVDGVVLARRELLDRKNVLR